jgi:hypothetical protein
VAFSETNCFGENELKLVYAETTAAYNFSRIQPLDIISVSDADSWCYGRTFVVSPVGLDIKSGLVGVYGGWPDNAVLFPDGREYVDLELIRHPSEFGYYPEFWIPIWKSETPDLSNVNNALANICANDRYTGFNIRNSELLYGVAEPEDDWKYYEYSETTNNHNYCRECCYVNAQNLTPDSVKLIYAKARAGEAGVAEYANYYSSGWRGLGSWRKQVTGCNGGGQCPYYTKQSIVWNIDWYYRLLEGEWFKFVRDAEYTHHYSGDIKSGISIAAALGRYPDNSTRLDVRRDIFHLYGAFVGAMAYTDAATDGWYYKAHERSNDDVDITIDGFIKTILGDRVDPRLGVLFSSLSSNQQREKINDFLTPMSVKERDDT